MKPTPAPTAAAPTAKPTSPMKLLGLNTPAPTLPVLYSNFPSPVPTAFKATAAPTKLDDDEFFLSSTSNGPKKTLRRAGARDARRP